MPTFIQQLRSRYRGVKRSIQSAPNAIARIAALAVLVTASHSTVAVGPAEKPDLRFGFIKLTDMAPLAIALEKGYFEDEGLFVELEAQANWKVLLDGVIDGQLDGAHMLAGQPLAATIGYGTKADIITPFSMDLNGNGITVSNEVWKAMEPNIPKNSDGKPQHPIHADALKPVIEKMADEGESFKMGMVFPVSTHNYELRYWLAAGGHSPGLLCAPQGRHFRPAASRSTAECHTPTADALDAGGGHYSRLLRR